MIQRIIPWVVIVIILAVVSPADAQQAEKSRVSASCCPARLRVLQVQT